MHAPLFFLRRSTGAAALALALAACATPYGDVGNASAGGYSDRKVSEGVYEVRFRGNAFTTRARARDLALLRAAEVVEAGGCASFSIVGGENDTQVANAENTTLAYGLDPSGVFGRTDVGEAPSYINAMPSVETVVVLRVRCSATAVGPTRASASGDLESGTLPSGNAGPRLYDPAAVQREMRMLYELG